MKRLTTTLIVATLSIGTAQAAVYKCEGPNGKLTFSDQPCQGEPSEEVTVDYVKPSAKQRLEAAEAAASHQRMAEQREQQQAERARQAQIASIQNSIDRMQKARDRELAALRIQKRTAANNLAGASYLQSISQEMEAVTQRYAADIGSARAELARLRAQGN